MAIDPESSENLFWLDQNIFLIGIADRNTFCDICLCIVIDPLHSRKNTHITTAIFRKVGVEVGVKDHLQWSSEHWTSEKGIKNIILKKMLKKLNKNVCNNLDPNENSNKL